MAKAFGESWFDKSYYHSDIVCVSYSLWCLVIVVHYIGNRMHLERMHCVVSLKNTALPDPLSTGLCVCVILGAGADFVMLGGMLAGHDQCAGEVIEKNGRKVQLFYGMSSDTAMKKHVGGVAEYR